MDKANISKIAQTAEDKLFLAKIWDKINSGMQRNIVAASGFLSPRKQEMCRYLFGNADGLIWHGGYEDAERKMLIYLPDYLNNRFLMDDESPIACIRATYFKDDELSHRDFLGALIGIGITRDSIGDICISKGSCDFFVTKELAEYVLLNFESAGRTKLHLTQISLAEVAIAEAETAEIKDTVASLRLDSIISSGFRIGRNLASQHILAGRAAIDGLVCDKPDRAVAEGAKISVRGLGKIQLRTINGNTKKGRISIIIDRYI